jgi:uncharacterized membrane protein YbhN (UPF0104 family)
LILLGIAFHLILPQITVLKNSWQVLLQMQLWAVGIAFMAQVLSYPGSGYLLQQTLLIMRQNVSFMRSNLIVLGEASIGLVAGGTVDSSAAIFRWMSTRGGNLGSATMAIILPWLFNSLVLVLLSIFGLVHLIVAHNLTLAQVIGVSALLFILGGLITIFALSIHFRSQAIIFVASFVRHLAQLLHKVYDSNQTQKRIKNFFSTWDTLRQGQSLFH